MNSPWHAHRLGTLIAMIWLLAACSENATDPVGGDIDSADPTAEATIGPDGGTVRATAADGTDVTFAFPEGALRQAEIITISTLAPTAESWLRVEVTPAGLALAEPVAIRVRVPDDVTVPPGSALFFGIDRPVYLQTTWDPGARILSANVSMLGFPANPGERSAANAAPSTNMGAGAATCQALSDAAKDAFDLFADQANYTSALAYYEAFQSLAVNADCPLDTLAWMQAASEAACQGYEAAVENAEVFITTDYGDLYALVGPLVHWGSVAAAHDSCFDANEWLTQIGAEFDEFMLFYGPQLEAVVAGDFTSYKELREEAHALIGVWEEAETLGFADEAQQLVQTMITPFMNILRQVAYAKCYEDKDHYFLTKLIESEFFGPADVLPTGGRVGRVESSVLFPFTDTDIQHDLQYCASCLTLTSVPGPGGTPDRVGAGDPDGDEEEGPGIGSVKLGSLGGPEQVSFEGELDFDPTGTLILSGEIRRFVCFPPSQSAGDYLTITLDGSEVATVPSTDDPDLMHEDITLDLPAIFSSLGETPQPGDTYTLRIWRHRTDCATLIFGPPDFLLFEVTLIALETLGELVVEIEAPETIKAGEPVQVIVRAGHMDAQGNPVWEPGLDVEITDVDCGSVGTTQGETPFTTMVTIADDPACDEVDIRVEVTDDAGQTESEWVEIERLLPDTFELEPEDTEFWASVLASVRVVGQNRDLHMIARSFHDYYDPLAPIDVNEQVEGSADTDVIDASGQASVSQNSTTSTDGLNSLTAQVSVSAGGSASFGNVAASELERWSVGSYVSTDHDILIRISGRPFNFVISGTADPGTRIELGHLSIVDGEVVGDGGYPEDDEGRAGPRIEVTGARRSADGAFHVEGTIRHDPSEVEEIWFEVDVSSSVQWNDPETSASGSHAAEADVTLTMSRELVP